jgi:hypothetical protein
MSIGRCMMSQHIFELITLKKIRAKKLNKGKGHESSAALTLLLQGRSG